MNLIDAVKTGKKFYRRSWLDKTPISFEDLHKLSKEAFIADDWEVESEVFVYSQRCLFLRQRPK